MSDREKCVVCDFPLATKADYDAYVGARATVTHDTRVLGARYCWSACGLLHAGPPIDWRARALEMEAQRNVAVHETHDLGSRVEALEGAVGAIRALADSMRSDMTGRFIAAELDQRIDRVLSATSPKPAPRPDVTEALRVAREALEGLLNFDPVGRGRRIIAARAALELLRAHVEPTKQPAGQGTKS